MVHTAYYLVHRITFDSPVSSPNVMTVVAVTVTIVRIGKRGVNYFRIRLASLEFHSELEQRHASKKTDIEGPELPREIT